MTAHPSRPLRILHVTPYSAEAWAYGGIPRLAATLTRGLARRGHQVTVCTTDVCNAMSRLSPREGQLARRAWPARWTHDRVEIRVFPNVSNRLAYHCKAFLPIGLQSYMRQHAAAFDVAHLHACRNLPGVIAARHLQRHRIPYVLAPNGTAPRIERLRVVKRAFDAAVGQRIIDRADRVLAVSDTEQRDLAALGVAASAIALIPNPVDLDEFAKPVERGRFRTQHSLGSEPLILFLGKLTPRKRVDVLIRAFSQLRLANARLVIAGNDMGSRAPAEALVHSLGLREQTLFTGLLTGPQRLEALSDADVVVYPSEHEIFGLVPLEAMLSGTPVIVADDSGCGAIVGALRGGQVVPLGSAEALAAAIRRVFDAPAVWRELATESQGQIRRAYGDDAVCAELEALYLGLVA
ncbi:MAG: glycosyltransferase [Vicinamibacterales bacterium]